MKALNETNTISTIPVLYKAWRKCNKALKCDVFSILHESKWKSPYQTTHVFPLTLPDTGSHTVPLRSDIASTIKTTSDIHDFFATAAPSISITFVKYPGLQSTDAPHVRILDGWGRAKILWTVICFWGVIMQCQGKLFDFISISSWLTTWTTGIFQLVIEQFFSHIPKVVVQQSILFTVNKLLPFKCI